MNILRKKSSERALLFPDASTKKLHAFLLEFGENNIIKRVYTLYFSIPISFLIIQSLETDRNRPL